VVTGGTGLYIRALTRGMFEGPEADWELREALMEEPAPVLYKRLGEMDPEAASSVSPGDLRRIVRALEVCIKSGKRVSKLREEATEPLPYDYLKVGLYRDRAELYPMIEERVDRMMERGLLEEVRALLDEGMDRTAMQAIGYKEIAGHLRGEYSLEEAVVLIKRNTRRYAKRQYTWFRREEALRWVDVTGLRSAEEAYALVKNALHAAGVS
jgi:tRNA dimethylallyltransferase